ncbi:type IV conjugative transfer system protein TraE [Thermodesulfobacteriota bacterium B35]
MKTDIFLQKSSNLWAENRLLRFVIIILTLTVVINSFMVYRAVRYERVILIPPRMTGTVEFVQGRPTDRYVKDLCRRIVNLAATYSPATARAQFDELLFYYAPESYPAASKEWYSLAGRIEDSGVSSVFYLEKIKIDKDTMEVFGSQRQFAAGDTPLENGSKTYLVKYRIQDGRLYVLSIKEQLAGEEQ